MKRPCFHNLKYTGNFVVGEDSECMYSIRTYRCTKCGAQYRVNAKYVNPVEPMKAIRGFFFDRTVISRETV